MSPFSQRFLLSRSISPWSCHWALWSNSSGPTPTFHAYPCGGKGSKTVNWLSSRMKTSFLWLTSCSHIGNPNCVSVIFPFQFSKLKTTPYQRNPLESRKSVHLGLSLKLLFFLLMTINKMRSFAEMRNHSSSQMTACHLKMCQSQSPGILRMFTFLKERFGKTYSWNVLISLNLPLYTK